MYLSHFGLQRPPFKITPDTSMFYPGNKRGAALQALKYAIMAGEGIIKVVGEVGSGKTMLCRMLEVELDDSVEVVYIANPSLSPDNILHVIAFELKLDITPASSKLEVMQTLQNYLLARHANNKQVVVFVEEAQSMPIETLEEIRLLSNLETNEHKLLQMVLFGQPELDEKLRKPAIRQLKERITHNFYLDPFPANDVYEYLNFRMRAVGYCGPDLFSQKMANRIEHKSSGLTRRINILADKALLAAYSEGGHNIDKKHIDLAAKDSDFGQHGHSQPALKVLLGIAVIIASVWLGSLLPSLFSNQPAQSDAPMTMAEPADEPAGESAAAPSMTSERSEPPAQIMPADTAADASEPEQQTSATAAQADAAENPAAFTLPAQTGSTPPAVAVAMDLQQQLALTEQWIEVADNNNYTIQLNLIDAWATQKVEQYLQRVAETLPREKLFIYPASIQGRMVYSVLYNDYAAREAATEQLRRLAPWIKQNAPYLRTVKGIRSDIRKTEQQTALQPDEATP